MTRAALLTLALAACAIPPHPDASGCPVVLPDYAHENWRPLSTTADAPRSSCDPSEPIAYGGSLWDTVGRRR